MSDNNENNACNNSKENNDMEWSTTQTRDYSWSNSQYSSWSQESQNQSQSSQETDKQLVEALNEYERQQGWR